MPDFNMEIFSGKRKRRGNLQTAQFLSIPEQFCQYWKCHIKMRYTHLNRTTYLLHCYISVLKYVKHKVFSFKYYQKNAQINIQCSLDLLTYVNENLMHTHVLHNIHEKRRVILQNWNMISHLNVGETRNQFCHHGRTNFTILLKKVNIDFNHYRFATYCKKL